MINLLPPKQRLNIVYAKKNTVLRRYVELLLGAVLIVCAVMAGSFYFLKAQEQNTLKSVELSSEQIKELEGIHSEAQQLSVTVNTIATLLSRDVKFSSMLKDIGELMPPRAVLSGLELSNGDSKAPLVVSARVENEQTAAVLRNNLASSDLFEKAEIVSITKNGEDESQAEEETQLDTYGYTVLINAYFTQKTGAIR